MIVGAMLRHIRQVNVKPNYVLELAFDNESPVEVDLSSLIAAGGVWEALRDPAAFSKVSIGEYGRSLEWPGELDLCADALWIEAHEHNPVK